jgi:hypothetical protein
MDFEYVDAGELAAIEAAMAAAEQRASGGGGGAYGGGGGGGNAHAHAPPQRAPQQWHGGPGGGGAPQHAPQLGWQAQQQQGGGPQWRGGGGGGGGGGNNAPNYFAMAPPQQAPRWQAPQQQHAQQQQQQHAQQQQQQHAPPPYGGAPRAPALPPACAVSERAEHPHGGGGNAYGPHHPSAHGAPPPHAPHAPPEARAPPPVARVELRLLPDTRVAVSVYPPALGGVAEALRAAPGAEWSAPSNAWLVPAASVPALREALRDARAEVQPLPPIAAAALDFASRSLVSDADADAAWQRVPASLRDSMFPFQREGVKYAIRRAGRALIGDEMVRVHARARTHVHTRVHTHTHTHTHAHA